MRVRIKDKGLWTTIYYFTVPVGGTWFTKPKYETYVYCKNKDGLIERFHIDQLEKFE